MYETSEETDLTSPLQLLLRGAFCIQKLKNLLDLEQPKTTNKEDVQQATAGE